MTSLRIGAVLAVGALVASASACGSPGPATTGLSKQWSITQTGGTTSAGTWLTGGMLVTGSDNGLTARDLRTGHTDWSWHPPAPPSGDYPSIVMTSGTSPSDGIGLVNYSYARKSGNTPDNAPDYQAGIDLADGHTLWTSTVNASLNVDLPGYLTGDGVIASIDEHGNSHVGYVAATSLETGKPAWSTASEQGLKSCVFTGLAFAGALAYGLATCGSNPAVILYGLSARTGAVESKVTLADQSCARNALGPPTLWAVSGYLLVGCPGGETAGRQQLVMLHAGSTRQTVVTYSSPSSALDYPDDRMENEPYFITGTELYIEADDSSYNLAVTAISLTSGKVLWQKEPPGYLMSADSSGALIAGKPSDSGSNSSPVSLSMASLSASSGAVSYGPGTTFDVANPDAYGLFFTGHTLIASAAGTGNSPAIIAYGTGSWSG